MHESDRRAAERARAQRNLVTRQGYLEDGGTDRRLETRRRHGHLTIVHRGVYTAARAPLDWRDAVLAACLATGEGSRSSHRAGVLVWRLDGIGSAPVEITVAYGHDPAPKGVIVHRTRRLTPAVIVDGIPVTTLERTLLDAAGCMPSIAVEKALESALRRGLTTERKLTQVLAAEGGKGVKGAAGLRRILEGRPGGGAAGSGAEVEFWRAIAGRVEPPVRQYVLDLGNGIVFVLDLAWPDRRKGVEIDGLDTHGSGLALDADLDRQNRILEAGWRLRRYSGRRVHRDPHGVADSIVRFLAEP